MKSGDGEMVEKNSVNQKATGRLPKFIKQRKIGKPLKPLHEDRWKVFFDKSKGPGKKQSIDFIFSKL